MLNTQIKNQIVTNLIKSLFNLIKRKINLLFTLNFKFQIASYFNKKKVKLFSLYIFPLNYLKINKIINFFISNLISCYKRK